MELACQTPSISCCTNSSIAASPDLSITTGRREKYADSALRGGGALRRGSLHLLHRSLFLCLLTKHTLRGTYEEAPWQEYDLKKRRKGGKSWCTDLQEQGQLCVAHWFRVGTVCVQPNINSGEGTHLQSITSTTNTPPHSTYLIICPICDHGSKRDFFYRAENTDQDVNNCSRISLQGKIAHNTVLLQMEVWKGEGEERRESSSELCPETQISVRHQRKPLPWREQNMGREKEKEIDEMKEGSQAWRDRKQTVSRT